MRTGSLLAVTAAVLALASSAQAANLVVNGDFSAGNSVFTSGYTYSPGSNTTEGEYTIRTDPYPWNSNFVSVGDHTTGTGLMFVGNGSPTLGQLVWQSGTIAIDPTTNYFFEAFVMNVCCNASYGGANSPPVLDFSISLNGGAPVLLNTLTIPLSPAGVWHGLSTSFNSGGSTTAVLSLINGNTAPGGNDFAVDDIFLGTVSTVGGIPEPGTWAMLLAGFAGIGSALRSRRKVRIAAVG
jgi:hypothetical protein|nr:hypothetical protein [Phenylobacterium sp.]